MKLLRIQFLLILIFSLTLTFLKAEETKIENKDAKVIKVNKSKIFFIVNGVG